MKFGSPIHSLLRYNIVFLFSSRHCFIQNFVEIDTLDCTSALTVLIVFKTVWFQEPKFVNNQCSMRPNKVFPQLCRKSVIYMRKFKPLHPKILSSYVGNGSRRICGTPPVPKKKLGDFLSIEGGPVGLSRKILKCCAVPGSILSCSQQKVNPIKILKMKPMLRTFFSNIPHTSWEQPSLHVEGTGLPIFAMLLVSRG